jgi:GH15 family glucan-1,4-alpha-glucosidase
VYTIHGGKDLPEEVLDHLEGHKGSRPVRIGNGAVSHLQLVSLPLVDTTVRLMRQDIYGELIDSIYLAQKFSKPLSWDSWVALRKVVDYVCDHVDTPDLSIWEVRGKRKNFIYSKVMMWVAIDRGLRLAEKRTLPCPNRARWMEVRDKLYEDVQVKGWK